MRFVKGLLRVIGALALTVAASLSLTLTRTSVAHAEGQVSIQVSGTDDVLATLQVALLDEAGVDVAPASCTTEAQPELLILTCAGLVDGSYRATVVAPASVVTVSEFCSPADPSLDPEPDGTIRLRPDADLFICTKQVAATRQASEGPIASPLLPASGSSPMLAAVAVLLVGVGLSLSHLARRPVR